MIGWSLCCCFVWLCGFIAAMAVDRLIATHTPIPNNYALFVRGWKQGYRVAKPKKDLITGRFVG